MLLLCFALLFTRINGYPFNSAVDELPVIVIFASSLENASSNESRGCPIALWKRGALLCVRQEKPRN